MLIRLEIDEAVEILMNRVRFWTRRDGDDNANRVAERLYEEMYTNYVESFEESETPFGEHSINDIVDNDWINNCTIIYNEKGGCDEKRYKALKKHFDEEGLCDVSCDKECGCSRIEAYDEKSGAFLVRY